MEEILASIRKILTDEEGGAGGGPMHDVGHDDHDEHDDDVLVLDSTAMVPPGMVPPGQDETLSQAGGPLHSESAMDSQGGFGQMPGGGGFIPASVLQPGDHFPLNEKDKNMDDNVQSPDGLVGEKVASEIANTVGSLVRSVSAERAVAIGRVGVTIEDLVREEVKPVLKAWLDTHLPSLVERVVRAEIGRVIDRM